MGKLKAKFFEHDAEIVARELLGKVLVHKISDKILTGKIVETEAYVGPQDQASHASRKKTPRNSIMFEQGGHWYVYFIYGMYFNLNIVTGKKDFPAAVLIRALEPLEGIELMKQNRKTENISNLTNGPGKLCKALQIDKSFNATSGVSNDANLYIEDRGIIVLPKNIISAKRIGVEYAGKWKDKLLRFYLKDNEFVSKKG